MFKPFREKKCWGNVLHVFADDHAAVSCLEVVAGFCCSKHKHAERANLFALHSGCVVIETQLFGHFEKSGRVTRNILRAGSTLYVCSRMWHRFLVMESGQMTEVYYPDRGGKVDIHDIKRMDEGGSFNINETQKLLEKEPPYKSSWIGSGSEENDS